MAIQHVLLAGAVMLAACGGRSPTPYIPIAGSLDGGIRLADGELPGPKSACNPTTARRISSIGSIVVCESIGTTGYSQCESETKLCGPGYALCPASTYRAEIGADSAPAAVRHATWIGGCVRAGSTVHAPTERSCSSCAPTTTRRATHSWHCATQTEYVEARANIGLASSTLCRRVGVNSAVTEGLWRGLATDQRLLRAFCCDR